MGFKKGGQLTKVVRIKSNVDIYCSRVNPRPTEAPSQTRTIANFAPLPISQPNPYYRL